MEGAAKELSDKIEEAKLIFMMANPFWSNILAHLKIEIKQLKGAYAATDGRYIYLSPRVKELEIDVIAGIIAHEVMHVAFLHLFRAWNKIPVLWNIATDIVVNNVIKYHSSALRLPHGVFVNRKFDGYSAEEVYELLWKNLFGQSGIQGEKEIINKRVIEEYGRYRFGDEHREVGGTPDERKKLEEEVKRWLIESYEIWSRMDKRRRGTLPGYFVEYIETLMGKKIPWQRILYRFLSEVFTKDEYSPLPPSRKYIPYDLYSPTLKNEKPEGCIVVAVDVSGSMTSEDIKEALGEINLLKEFAEEIWLIFHDVRITDFYMPQEVKKVFEKEYVKITGRGGTSHREVFEFIEDNNIKPDLFIGFTDGYSEFPEEEPPYPVIWILCKDYRKPPWGIIIEMGIKSKRKSIRKVDPEVLRRRLSRMNGPS